MTYLIAATRGNSPLSPFMFRKIIYATYEILGMAKIKWTKDKEISMNVYYYFLSI